MPEEHISNMGWLKQPRLAAIKTRATHGRYLDLPPEEKLRENNPCFYNCGLQIPLKIAATTTIV